MVNHESPSIDIMFRLDGSYYLCQGDGFLFRMYVIIGEFVKKYLAITQIACPTRHPKGAFFARQVGFQGIMQ